ncbi:TRAFAC clade GTPase domain-containing protein [Pseudomonas knackmussii]|uniref:TRAFAC clade GTPase domain-containing protein n=1 Tax=Pseudomonas knackmussii TaxID=65741 RepID=UPI003F4A782A
MTTEDEDVVFIRCANPDCRVSETGRCVEGLDIESCPHYGQEAEIEDENLNDTDGDAEDPGLMLPSAETLTVVEATHVLCQGETRVIAVIGPTESGKTSLVASLYDLFQEGPVGEIEFSRSRTLIAFEHTCHDARSASRRSTPHINRTPHGSASFYHIEVGVGDRRVGLLLGDRAGEEYRSAADDVSVVPGFSEVMRADTLTVLIDGGRLIDAGARHNLKSDIVMMLQGFSEGGGLRKSTRLALVLTKLDLVRASANSDRVLKDFGSLAVKIQKLFGDSLSEVELFQIAASPSSAEIERGTGIPELLRFWLKTPTLIRNAVQASPQFVREFMALLPLEEPND